MEGDHKKVHYSKSGNSNAVADEDRIDVKFFKKTFTEKEHHEQKRTVNIIKDSISDTLRDLCLPKLLCEIAAKPTYLQTDKEKYVLSLLK